MKRARTEGTNRRREDAGVRVVATFAVAAVIVVCEFLPRSVVETAAARSQYG